MDKNVGFVVYVDKLSVSIYDGADSVYSASGSDGGIRFTCSYFPVIDVAS